MTSSCAGDEIAATIFISLPQRLQSVGSSSQILAISRDQFRFLSRTNARSSPSMTATEGGFAVSASFLIQPNRLRVVVDAAPYEHVRHQEGEELRSRDQPVIRAESWMEIPEVASGLHLSRDLKATWWSSRIRVIRCPATPCR